jgi:hypothetical protein
MRLIHCENAATRCKLLPNIVMSDLNCFVIKPYFYPCKKENGRLLSCDTINKPQMIGLLLFNNFIIHHSLKTGLVRMTPLQVQGIKYLRLVLN